MTSACFQVLHLRPPQLHQKVEVTQAVVANVAKKEPTPEPEEEQEVEEVEEHEENAEEGAEEGMELGDVPVPEDSAGNRHYDITQISSSLHSL